MHGTLVDSRRRMSCGGPGATRGRSKRSAAVGWHDRGWQGAGDIEEGGQARRIVWRRAEVHQWHVLIVLVLHIRTRSRG